MLHPEGLSDSCYKLGCVMQSNLEATGMLFSLLMFFSCEVEKASTKKLKEVADESGKTFSVRKMCKV